MVSCDVENSDPALYPEEDSDSSREERSGEKRRKGQSMSSGVEVTNFLGKGEIGGVVKGGFDIVLR